ncbi:hypothetical protein PV326_001939, partial [Microctonus aethiopoides]
CKRWQQINQIIWLSMRKFEYIVIDSDDIPSLISIRNGLKLKNKDFSIFGGILRKFNGSLEKLAITTDFECVQPLEIPSWIFKLIIENENLNSVEITVHNKHIYTQCLNFLKTDNLQHLKLSRHLKFKHSTSVLDAIKKLLLNAPRLETLYLTNVPISIQEINKITTLKSLWFDLSNLPDLPVKKFDFINLESIHLTLCPNINDKFIKHLVENCPKLCNVEIYACDLITEKGLIPITTLPELRHFSASKMNDEVFDKLSNLETFCCPILSLNRNTMNTTIVKFFRRSPNLKMAQSCVNDDFHLFDEYARKFGIKFNHEMY